MIVRCGKCRSELEVAGAGEFLCPRCGTRNVVRGAAAPSPFDLGDLSTPGPPPEPTSQAKETEPTWVSCPACSWRFIIGPKITEVICPTCRAELEITEGTASLAKAES